MADAGTHMVCVVTVMIVAFGVVVVLQIAIHWLVCSSVVQWCKCDVVIRQIRDCAWCIPRPPLHDWHGHALRFAVCARVQPMHARYV